MLLKTATTAATAISRPSSSSSSWLRIGFPIAVAVSLSSILFFEHLRHLSTRRERVKKLKKEFWEVHGEEGEEDLEMEEVLEEKMKKDGIMDDGMDLNNYNDAAMDLDHDDGADVKSPIIFSAIPFDIFRVLSSVGDALLFPFTSFLGWLEFGGGGVFRSGPGLTNQPSKWRQKIYHSLIVAGRFVNPFIEWNDKSTADVFAYFKWQLTRNNRNGSPSKEELERNLPVITPNFDLLHSVSSKRYSATSSSSPKLSESWIVADKSSAIMSASATSAAESEQFMTVTWIGQSTCFIQMDGYNILTDPIFTTRTLNDWLGPKRLCKVPCKLSELPPIDLVLVSHNHYDHLDLSVLQELGNKAVWYVPLGLKSWMARHGVDRCVELDWWQEYMHDDRLCIISTPAQHWSGRHFFDVNSTLWSSFICKTSSSSGSAGNASFFHCGDSGYCTVFKEIGDRYGPITFSALPIGSYEPRYFMQHQHMSPAEAVQVSKDLQCVYSLGVHWGTFMMSDEHYLDPKIEFYKAASEAVEKDKSADHGPPLGCFTLNFGETRILKL